jgi:type IV secretory pathway TraG/TraD family ATPase VirD4
MLLTDEDFREKYLKQIKNPFLQKFWSTEFDTMSQVRQAEVVSPILNKVGQFLSVPLIRNIVSQPQSGFSPRWVMDNHKIFLANLSKGKIGEDVSDMFGSMLVSKFQLDVMSRATIEPEKRVPFRLYVDEFQNFATESFADIFSEARKYNLELIIAHQYLGQVDKKLIEAILGNVGNIIAFHTSNEDAKILAPNMSKNLDISLLTEQQSYSFILKTVKNGKKKVETGELLAPDLVTTYTGVQSPEKLQNLVREKFAKKREFVEGKLSNKIEQ